MDFEENALKESEFNFSVATLMRLDEIKKYLDASTIENDPDKKFYHLKAFWLELDCMIAPSEQKEQLEYYSQCTKHANENKNGMLTKEKLMAFLDEWEISLRRTDQAHNLNMKMGRDKRWVV